MLIHMDHDKQTHNDNLIGFPIFHRVSVKHIDPAQSVFAEF